MATVNMTHGGQTGSVTRWASVETPEFVQIEIDLVEAAAKKGSDLAAADVIEALIVPADTVVFIGGVELAESIEGATALTVDFGTAGSPQAFVTAFDAEAAAEGDQSVGTTALVSSAPQVLGLTLATLTGTITGGKLRAFAMMLDISEKAPAGIAQPGS